MSRLESLFFEVFEALPRQGPGNRESTARALAMCAGLPERPRVLDLGCGSGAQTLDLVALCDATVLALDAHGPLVERLRETVAGQGLADRIEARVADMGTVELPQQFDLIWSEGALYNLGIERALERCVRWVKPGGYLAFTEAVWLTGAPSDAAQAAFADYPAMGDREAVRATIEASAFELVGDFVLPDEAWWQGFYAPMLERIDVLREHYREDREALEALDAIAGEAEVWRAGGFGYGFFVVRG